MNHGMNNPTGIYIQYYNAIARTLTALGRSTTLKPPNTSSVTQTDLTVLRNSIRSLAQNTLDMDEFNSHRNEENAFDKYRMTVNDKKGFLIVPGKYTDNGPDLYEYELDENGDPSQENVLSFSTVPVLYEHFEDMMKVLQSLKHIVMTSSLYRTEPVRSDNYWVQADHAPEGFEPTPMPGFPALPYYSNWTMRNKFQSLGINYFLLYISYCRTYYIAQKRNAQSPWENLDSDYRIFLLDKEYTASTIEPEGIITESNSAFHWVDDAAPKSRDFYIQMPGPDYSIALHTGKIHDYSIPRQHIVWVVPDDFALPPWIPLDHRENGLLYCGCEDDDFAKCSTQGPYEIRYGLGSTDNTGGARLRLYETNLRMPYFDAYCLDKETVSISDFGSVRTVTRDGETIRFRFSTVLRPNGALVPMFWKFDGDDTTYALPVSGCGYRLSMVNATDWEIRFSDKAVHVFNNLGVFSKAYLKKDDEILSATWTGIAVTNQSGTPSVCTVTSPQGTAQMSYTSGNPEALLTLAYRIMPATPGKLYGHTTVVSAGRKRGFVHRLLLDPTIANPTVDDLSVVSEAYISLPSEDEAEAPETETTTGSLEQPYSSLKTAWTHDNEVGDLRLVTSTVNGKSFSQAQVIRPSSRGDLVLESTAGEDSAQPLTTRFEYDDNGLRTRQDNPDGTWQNWNYDFSERLLRSIRPFKVLSSASRRAASADELEVTDYSYEPNAPGEIVEPGDTRVRRTIRTINDIEVERTYQVYLENEYRSIRCRTSGATWDAPDNLVTIQYSYLSGDWQGRHWKTLNPDGTASLTTYAVDDSDGLVETTDSGVLNPDGTAIIDGTRQIVTRNVLGFTTAREIVDIASGLTLDTTTYEVDFAGRPLKTTYADGSESTTVYACCGPFKETGRDGAVTTTTYTPDKKVAGREQAGVRVAYVYDPNGGVAEIRTIGTDGSYQLSVNQYAENGLLTAVKTALEAIPVDSDPPETDDAYAVTAFAEAADPQTGGWIRTTTYPDGGIRVEDYDQTGSLRHAHGTAVAAEMEYENLLLNAEVCARSALIRPNGIREVTDVLTDFAGRQYKTVHPNGSYDLTEFDVLNRPWRQTAADGTVRITEYNPKGEVSRTGIDLDRDGERNGDDPATVYENDVVLKESTAVRRRTTKEQDGNDLVTVNISESTADGNRSWETSFGRTSSFRRSYVNDEDEQGVIETQVQPDGSSETRSYHDGLLESSLHSVLGETLYTYDAFNRQETVSHVEGGIEHVIAYQYDGRNQVTTITETGGSSSREMSFTYDLNGRKLSETRPGDRTVTFEYYPTGELKKVTGAETYPQSYTYEAGRLATLTTFKTDPGPGASTNWQYNSFGQLAAKRDALNRIVQYGYNAFGQLISRIWSRNIVTNYGYDNAGRLNSITYDDDTPDVSYVYDQRGRLTQVTDAAGVRDFTYNPDNTSASESIPDVPGISLHREYDELGRQTDLQLIDDNRPELPVYAVTRSYDDMSRPSSIGIDEAILNYTYVAGANDRIAATQWRRVRPGGQPPARNFTYDDFRRLTGISAVVNYTLNDRDQRTNANYTGSDNWSYRYDDLGQLVEAQIGTRYTWDYDSSGNRTRSGKSPTTTGADLYTTNVLNQYTRISPTTGPTNQTYDLDGNLLLRNNWTHTWDGENRLVRMVNGTYKLEFTYDYLGRRIEKKYTVGTVLRLHQRFIYDGYKLIEVRNALSNNAQESSFVWQPQNLDVPVAMRYRNQWGYYLYDGNKNIIRITDISGSTSLAFYRYLPFGEVNSSSGQWVDANPFRFSSEYQDIETGMIYYNYRYYSTIMGRWISRDPIEEEGGVNLYAMVGNDPVNQWDNFGLKGYCGKDITKQLDNIINSLEDAYTKNLLRDEHFFGMISANGFDITKLYYAGHNLDREKDSGKERTIELAQSDLASKHGNCKPCDRTVVVHGKCYKVWAVNYILFGKLMQLRNRYRRISDDPLRFVLAYRRSIFNRKDPGENELNDFGTGSRLLFTSLGFSSGTRLAGLYDNYPGLYSKKMVGYWVEPTGSGAPFQVPLNSIAPYNNSDFWRITPIFDMISNADKYDYDECLIDESDIFTGYLSYSVAGGGNVSGLYFNGKDFEDSNRMARGVGR